MDPLTLALSLALSALLIDGILGLALIANMVSWIRTRAGRSFLINSSSTGSPSSTTTFPLHGKPLLLKINQDHISNDAAGAVVVLVCLGGILALVLRHFFASPSARKRDGSPRGKHSRRFAKTLYYAWLVVTGLSPLFTLSALVFTFVMTKRTSGQKIEVAVAEGLGWGVGVDDDAYPFGEWVPETWFGAVLELPLALSEDVRDIRSQRRLMVGWRWNLVPLFILGVTVCALAILDARRWRARMRRVEDVQQEKLDTVSYTVPVASKGVVQT